MMVPPFCGDLEPSNAPIANDGAGVPTVVLVLVLPMEDGVLLFPKGSPVVEPVDEGVAPVAPGVLGGGGGTISVILSCLLSGD